MFGEVVAGKMRLNRYGGIVWEEWLKTETIRPNVITDAFVVMPNHVHGIIGIHDFASRRGMARHAPTTVRQFGKPVPNSLPTIIGSFKSAVTKHINQQGRSTGTSVWQRGYYEHIVRNEHALNHIRRYIEENPLRWYYDRFYPDTTR